MHLRPDGKGVEAALEFQNEGGTHLIISHLPYPQVRISKEEDYQKQYSITLDMLEQVRKRTDLKAYCTLGPYPADLVWIAKEQGLERAESILAEGMRIAAEMVSEGRAIAIGEVGRPHFPVKQEEVDACNRVLELGMSLAKEIGCPMVLHVESGNEPVYSDLAKRADKIGLPREKLVRHYASPPISNDVVHGLFPSVLARKSSVLEALKDGTRFMMETDFIDDPKRPGAVLSPRTVPKRTRNLVESGHLDEEAVFKIHQDNPTKVYGVDFGL